MTLDPGVRSGRIAIVGGGVGGLVAAIALRQRGFTVDLFERWPRIEPVGSGISLSSPPLVVLARLGVSIDAIGVPAVLDFARADGATRTGPIQSAYLDAPFGASVYSLLRTTLHDALLQLLPRSALHPKRELVGFRDDASGVVLSFADGSEFAADLLIGADGLHSAVRKQLWGDTPLRHHGLVCWQGYAAYGKRPAREARIMHDVRRQVGHMPLRVCDRLGRQWWTIEVGAGASDESDPRARIAAELRAGAWQPFLADLVEATDPAVLIRREIVDRAPLRRWSRGRTTLLGDAAHATSPYAGYGAGMAIEDAWTLAALLDESGIADAAAIARAFTAYEQRRTRKTARTVEFARLLGRTFHSPNPVVRSVRDAMLDRTPLGGLAIRRGYLRTLTEEMRRL